MSSLTGELPETVDAFNALDQYARSQGIAIAIADYGGVRTQADTTQILEYRQNDYNAAVAAGKIPATMTLDQFRPIAPFGSSYHNYGAAFDITIQARPASMTAYDALALLGAYAPAIGLRWGGYFSNPDTPHFELAISLDDAAQRYASFLADGGAPSDDSGSPDMALIAIGVAIVGALVWLGRRKLRLGDL